MPDTRFASKRIFNPTFPKLRKPRAPKKPNPLGRPTPLTFSQTAQRAVSTATVSCFIAANATDSEAGKWMAPGTQQLLSACRAQMLSHPAEDYARVAPLADAREVQIVTALVGAAEGNDKDPIFPVLATTDTSLGSSVRLGPWRWSVAQRQCSTPRCGLVRGPYLLLAARSKRDGSFVRASLWPAAISDELNSFRLVRSHPERIAAGLLYDAGVTVVTPLRKSDQLELQRHLGRRWAGDLSTYPYVADGVILPSASCGHVGVFELFGLSSFRRYADAQHAKKRALTEGHMCGAFVSHAVTIHTRGDERQRDEIAEQLGPLLLL